MLIKNGTINIKSAKLMRMMMNVDAINTIKMPNNMVSNFLVKNPAIKTNSIRKNPYQHRFVIVLC